MDTFELMPKRSHPFVPCFFRTLCILGLLFPGSLLAQEFDYVGKPSPPKTRQAFSQDVTRVELSGQFAIPRGQLGSKNVIAQESGFAKEGGSGSISADYKFNQIFGIGIKGGYGLLPADVALLEEIYGIVDTNLVDLTAGSWNFRNVQVFGVIEYQVEQADFFFRFGAGIFGSRSPRIESVYQYPTATISLLEEGQFGSAPALNFALGSRLYIGDVFLSITGEATFSRHDVTVVVSQTGFTGTGQYSYTQDVALYRFGLGIGMRLQ